MHSSGHVKPWHSSGRGTWDDGAWLHVRNTQTNKFCDKHDTEDVSCMMANECHTCSRKGSRSCSREHNKQAYARISTHTRRHANKRAPVQVQEVSMAQPLLTATAEKVLSKAQHHIHTLTVLLIHSFTHDTTCGRTHTNRRTHTHMQTNKRAPVQVRGVSMAQLILIAVAEKDLSKVQHHHCCLLVLDPCSA